MKRIIIACLLAILVTAAPVAADTAPVVFNFTFTGIVETSNYATGTMVLNTGDVGLLAINFPGRYVWDPTRSTTGEIISSDNLVQTLNVSVFSNNTLVRQYTRDDFDIMILDIALLTTVDLSHDQILIGQGTPNGPWGVYDPENPTVTGDFQFFAHDGTTAPIGFDYYTIATDAGAETGVSMQLTQFDVVPEPSTYVLLCLSLGVVGYARNKMRTKC